MSGSTLERAEELFGKEEFEQSLRLATEVLNEDYTHLRALELRFRCHKKLSQPIEAFTDLINLYLELQKRGQDNREPLHRAYLARAHLYIHEKDYDAAQKDGYLALDCLPGSRDAHAVLGQSHWQLGDFPQALRHLQVATVPPLPESFAYYDTGDLFLHLSWVLNALGHPEEALEAMSRGLSLTREPRVRGWLLWTRANHCFKTNQVEQACYDLEEARRTDPTNLFVEELLRAVLPVDPSEERLEGDARNTTHLLLRSIHDLRSENFHKALEGFDQIADRRKSDPRILWFIALTLEKLGNTADAEEQREAARRLAKDEGNIWTLATLSDPEWARNLTG